MQESAADGCEFRAASRWSACCFVRRTTDCRTASLAHPPRHVVLRTNGIVSFTNTGTMSALLMGTMQANPTAHDSFGKTPVDEVCS